MTPETLYSIDEVVLIASEVSQVDSRSECNPFYGKKLPIWIAAMSCLVDWDNRDKFDELGFNVILPRTVPFAKRLEAVKQGKWIAIGLEEGWDILKNLKPREDVTYNISIDIANGHQYRCVELCRELKAKFSNCSIMVGNIANPKTYLVYAGAGADYVRLGVGTGHVCTTSVQTGIHYPMASLISKCREYAEDLKEKFRNAPKIVADGGFGYIDQTVKGLALGADYVMIGSIAASFPEACGEVRLSQTQPVPPTWHQEREYYGMSTEKAQKLMHPDPNYVVKHSEGTVRWIPIRSSTQKWIDDFTHALKSSMSYCDAFNLEQYIGRVEWGVQSSVTFNAYIKS